MALVRLLGRRRAADGANQRGNAGAADADAEQDAAEHEVEPALGHVHDVHPRHGRKHTGHDHASGAVAIRHHAGPHRAEAPGQIGDRHGGRERLTADAKLQRHGRQVKAHHLAQSHGDPANQSRREDDEPQGLASGDDGRNLLLHCPGPVLFGGAHYRLVLSGPKQNPVQLLKSFSGQT